MAATTALDLGTLLLSVLNVRHDAVELELRDLGSLEGLRVEGVADDVLCDAGLEGLDELVVDALLDVDAGSGAAHLPVVKEDAKVDPADCVVDVCVVEHNVGGLSTELESHLLEVGVGSGLHDHAPNGGGAGEGDLVDVHVGGDGGTGDAAETGDDVDDTGGEAGLLDEGCGHEGGERGLLGGLNDDDVTGGNGGTNLP